MFELNANKWCTLRKAGATNLYGESSLGDAQSERCAVVRLIPVREATTVRADSGATRAHGDEFTVRAKVLLGPRSVAQLGDQLTVDGVQMRIMEMHHRYDALTGALDHYEVEGEAWA